MSTIDKNLVENRIVSYAKKIYARNPCGGAMHIILDDFNCSDEDIDFCIRYINDHEYPFDEIDLYCCCIAHLQLLTEKERSDLLTSRYDEYAKQNVREPVPNGYSKIEQALNLDKLACMEKILVTIKCSDLVFNVLLRPNKDFDDWVWDWDWWEGEDDVELIGAIALSDIRIEGNKLEYRKEE